MVDRNKIPIEKMHINCSLLPDHILCKFTQRDNTIITTINIQHHYRLQQNRRTNYKKADWTQFTEETGSAFAQITLPTNIHTVNIIFANIILMVDRHKIPIEKMHINCSLLPDHILCKFTQRDNTIITTINIQHDYRLQQNRRTNYKKADWTQFTEETGSDFAQITLPTNIHTVNIIFANIILMVDRHKIPIEKMHINCSLLPDHILCK